MPKHPANHNTAYRSWARTQFAAYSGCVALIESTDIKDASLDVGSCFHVGDGVFITARHVVENRIITNIEFDDAEVRQELLRDPVNWGRQRHGHVNVVTGPHFHPDPKVDVACFSVRPFPKTYIPIGGHMDNLLGQYELVLCRTLILGYPRVPFTKSSTLIASVGEINALVDPLDGGHPHFVISTMARGGFSGGPALVAYNEQNAATGTALLGVVTQSFTKDKEVAEQGYMAVLTVEPIYTCLEEHGLLPPSQSL
jgi:hypothetical protein